MPDASTLPVRMATAPAIACAIALILSGCGHRELKAPCGPEDGAPSKLSFAPSPLMLLTGSPLDQLSATGGGTGSIPLGDRCGPLRPIHGGRSLGGAPA